MQVSVENSFNWRARLCLYYMVPLALHKKEFVLEVSGYEISAFDSFYNLSLAEISIPKNIAANKRLLQTLTT